MELQVPQATSTLKKKKSYYLVIFFSYPTESHDVLSIHGFGLKNGFRTSLIPFWSAVVSLRKAIPTWSLLSNKAN